METGKPTVLCVEDDRSLCQILTKALTSEGYKVATAHDGDEAMAVVEEAVPDVVLLDLILPRRDGFAVLESIRALDGAAAQTPVLLLSGSSPTPEYKRRAAELGAVDLLTKPVPLDRLLPAVARALGDTKGPVAADPAAMGVDRSRSEGLSGSLERLPFPALLHHLHGLRATGVLHLMAEKKRKWIQLREGYPIAVRGNLVNECLGNILVRKGKLTPVEAAESRKRMKDGMRQGEVLVAMEALTEDEMVLALRAQAEQKLFEVFTWENGSFRFDLDGLLQKANALPLQTSPANLILTGVESRLPLDRVDELIARKGRAFVGRADSVFYRFQDIELADDQSELLDSLDGSTRLSHYRNAKERVRRTLYAFVATGLVELRRGPSAGDARAPQRNTDVSALQHGPRDNQSRKLNDDALRAEFMELVGRFRNASHFGVLGVEPDSSDHSVALAFERLAARAHPDRTQNASQAVKELASEVFARVGRARDALADARSRTNYVLELKREEREAAESEKGRQALEAEKHFQAGDAALRNRNYPTALLEFGRAVELYPEDGEYFAHYGYSLHMAHPEEESMLKEALEHVRKGIKLAGHREKPYLFMGRLFKADGRYDAAEKMFQRAVNIDPTCTEALSELRLMEARRKRSRGLIGRLLRR